MRTTADRIRHALMFEVIGLALVMGLGWLFFGYGLEKLGVIGIVGATIATLWNYLYNLIFDHALLRLRGTVVKTPAIRVVHAVLFEGGLLMALLPFIAWYLGVSLIEAFWLDLALAIFYLVYAFVFNWIYDLVFPIRPVPQAQPAA